MSTCAYCHFEGVEGDTCPKCKNATPESRTLLIGGIEPTAAAVKRAVELPTEVLIDRAGRQHQTPTKKRYPLFVWAAIGCFLLVGSILRATGADTPSSDLSSSAAGSKSADSHSIESDGKNLPVLVGKNVGTVRDFADKSALFPEFFDTSGVDMQFTLQPKHTGHGSWTDLLDPYFVCDQMPLPGVPLGVGSNKVSLTVSMDCEGAAVKRVTGVYKKAYGLWGPAVPTLQSWSEGNTFEGWVVGVARTGWFDGVEIKVATPFEVQTIELGGVSQASDPCPTKHPSKVYWDLALKEVQDLLPVGSPVIFTYSGSGPAVITTLQVDDALQTATQNMSSVNEQLVSQGFWEPDVADLTTSTVLERGAKWKLWWTEDASDYEKTLIKLANGAIKSGVGPIALCKGK